MHDSGGVGVGGRSGGSQVGGGGASLSDGGLGLGGGGASTNGVADLFAAKEQDFNNKKRGGGGGGGGSNAKLSSLDGSASLYNPAAPDPGSSTPIRGGGGGYYGGSDSGKAAAAFNNDADNAANEHLDHHHHHHYQDRDDGGGGGCTPAGVPPAMRGGSDAGVDAGSVEASMILVGAGFPASRAPREAIPPPIPTRPASYTPSTHHDSVNTLNNFDSVCREPVVLRARGEREGKGKKRKGRKGKK